MRAALVSVVVLALAGPALAASPRPDAHDRALAARLAAKVTALSAISQKLNDDPLANQAMKHCPAIEKNALRGPAARSSCACTSCTSA